MATARTFKVQSPLMHGDDIKNWQNDVHKMFKTIGITVPLQVDGKYGQVTRSRSRALAAAFGIPSDSVAKTGLTPAFRERLKKASHLDKAFHTKKAEQQRARLKRDWNKSKPKPANPILNGFDVSGYQPSNVTSVCPGGFAIIKATEGTHYVNPHFTAQLSGAKHSGKMVGLYHFADTNSAALEAQHFHNTIRPYVGSAILILDMEGPALASGAKWAENFLDRLHTLCGVRGLIYGSKGNICIASYGAVARKYKLYVAAYPASPPTEYDHHANPGTVSPWGKAHLYQYSDRGRLPGYSANLDLDIFYGDKDEWRALMKRSN